MTDYTIVDGELYHYGVKGMKWGVRRHSNNSFVETTKMRPRGVVMDERGAYKQKRPRGVVMDERGAITVGQAYKSAKAAGKQAAKDAINSMNASPKKHTLREYNNAARNAKRQAQMDSFRESKAQNKQIKDNKSTNPNRKREIAIAATAVAGTALAAYGAHKLTNAIRDKNFKHSMRNGSKILEGWAERGRLDIGIEQLKDTFDANYGASIPSIIKRNIANNSVNGKVDWKAIRNIYR